MLYREAEMLVLPSMYEGFGLPVVEAMANGTAVVAAAATSLPEIAGDAAIFASPEDPASFANAMARVHRDVDVRSDLEERGRKRSAMFSWERAAKETLVTYERATEEKRGR
jgi:glycosyltransferase involved in cell wall biosynthesis